MACLLWKNLFIFSSRVLCLISPPKGLATSCILPDKACSCLKPSLYLYPGPRLHFSRTPESAFMCISLRPARFMNTLFLSCPLLAPGHVQQPQLPPAPSTVSFPACCGLLISSLATQLPTPGVFHTLGAGLCQPRTRSPVQISCGCSGPGCSAWCTVISH